MKNNNQIEPQFRKVTKWDMMVQKAETKLALKIESHKQQQAGKIVISRRRPYWDLMRLSEDSHFVFRGAEATVPPPIKKLIGSKRSAVGNQLTRTNKHHHKRQRKVTIADLKNNKDQPNISGVIRRRNHDSDENSLVEYLGRQSLNRQKRQRRCCSQDVKNDDEVPFDVAMAKLYSRPIRYIKTSIPPTSILQWETLIKRSWFVVRHVVASITLQREFIGMIVSSAAGHHSIIENSINNNALALPLGGAADDNNNEEEEEDTTVVVVSVSVEDVVDVVDTITTTTTTTPLMNKNTKKMIKSSASMGCALALLLLLLGVVAAAVIIGTKRLVDLLLQPSPLRRLDYEYLDYDEYFVNHQYDGFFGVGVGVDATGPAMTSLLGHFLGLIPIPPPVTVEDKNYNILTMPTPILIMNATGIPEDISILMMNHTPYN